MLDRRFNFDACRDCTDLWNRQQATPPCVRALSLGSQGLMAVPTGKIGGNAAPSCPCIISWPEVVTYANGGAGSIRMTTEAGGLIQVLRKRMSADASRKWVQKPEWVGFMEKRSFHANFAGYFDAAPPDTPAALSGQWHFVRRLADDELRQWRQFRLENALDIDFNQWDKKFEYAVWKGIQMAPSRCGPQLAGMATFENLAIIAGSIAVMFGPQGAVLGIARAVLGIVGFGAMALHWGSMIEEFGAKVFSARRPQDLDAAAAILSNLLAEIALAGLAALFLAGVQKWREAASQAARTPTMANGRVVRYPRIRELFKTWTSNVRGGPFADFPLFRHRTIREVRAWLGANGFEQVANASASGESSEIWLRTRPELGRGQFEAVRIDPEGHPVTTPDLRRAPEGQITGRGPAGDGASLQMPGWGNTPHMHKDIVPADVVMTYMSDTSSGMLARGYTDLSVPLVRGGNDYYAQHIILNP